MQERYATRVPQLLGYSRPPASNGAAAGRPLSGSERLEAAVQSLSAREDLPVFSQHLHELVRLTNSDDDAPQGLASLVLKSVGLTNVILRRANSAAYNRSGRPILSVSRAIAMIGWFAVRDLAAGFLLFDHFHRKSPAARRLILRSTLTASCARQIGGRVGFARLEEAYVCGMFRDVGELLVACYLPRLHEEIEQRVRRGESLEAASAGVLSFTFDQLAAQVAARWQLPVSVEMAFSPSRGLGRAPQTEAESLQAIGAMSHALAGMMETASVERIRRELTEIAHDFRHFWRSRERDLGEVVEAAVQDVKSIWSAASVHLDARALDYQVKSILLATETPAAIASTPTDPDAAAGYTLASAVGDAGHAVEAGTDVNDTVSCILESVYRAGLFDRVVLAMVDASAIRIRGRCGFGEDIQGLVESFDYSLQKEAGQAAIALQRRHDVFSEQNRPHRSILPIAEGMGLCVMLPIAVLDVTLGCVYLDRREAAPPLTADERQQLKTIRDAVALVMEKSVPFRTR